MGLKHAKLFLDGYFYNSRIAWKAFYDYFSFINIISLCNNNMHFTLFKKDDQDEIIGGKIVLEV